MNKDFNKIIKEAKTFSLTKKEQSLIMSRVHAFVNENPPRVMSPYFSFFAIFKSRKLMPVFILLLAISVGGGTSFAANFALPGDLLYPVKIHVNERLQSFASFGAHGMAVVDTEQAMERLKEQEQLAIKGTVSSETKADIKANFIEHKNNVEKLIDEANANGDAETASKIHTDFQNVLDAHTSAAAQVGISNIDLSPNTEETKHSDPGSTTDQKRKEDSTPATDDNIKWHIPEVPALPDSVQIPALPPVKIDTKTNINADINTKVMIPASVPKVIPRLGL